MAKGEDIFNLINKDPEMARKLADFDKYTRQFNRNLVSEEQITKLKAHIKGKGIIPLFLDNGDLVFIKRRSNGDESISVSSSVRDGDRLLNRTIERTSRKGVPYLVKFSFEENFEEAKNPDYHTKFKIVTNSSTKNKSYGFDVLMGMGHIPILVHACYGANGQFYSADIHGNSFEGVDKKIQEDWEQGQAKYGGISDLAQLGEALISKNMDELFEKLQQDNLFVWIGRDRRDTYRVGTYRQGIPSFGTHFARDRVLDFPLIGKGETFDFEDSDYIQVSEARNRLQFESGLKGTKHTAELKGELPVMIPAADIKRSLVGNNWQETGKLFTFSFEVPRLGIGFKPR